MARRLTVSVVIPCGGADDEWRRQALAYVVGHYRRCHPDWPVYLGHAEEPWSKGRAAHDGVAQADGDILVIADADSFVNPGVLEETVRLVANPPSDEHVWGIPHKMVHRLDEDQTSLVLAGAAPDTRKVIRPAYTGPRGGGITVLPRWAWDTVGGIDPRYEGWGGEDLSFGWALSVLAGHFSRIYGDLVHLWHPHPAPDLRGSFESEDLVARYRSAYEAWRRERDTQPMRSLVEEARHAVGNHQ